MCAIGFIFRIVDGLHLLAFAFRIIGDDEFHWVEDCAYSASLLVEVFAYRSFEKSHVIECIKLGVANAVDKHADALWRVASTAHTAECGHTWVVPSVDEVLVYESV